MVHICTKKRPLKPLRDDEENQNDNEHKCSEFCKNISSKNGSRSSCSLGSSIQEIARKKRELMGQILLCNLKKIDLVLSAQRIECNK